MKVLFLGSQNIKECVMNGGMQCSKRNYDLIASVIDNENLFTAIIWNSKEKYPRNQYFMRCTNIRESLVSSFRMCRLYSYAEEKKILEYIEQVDPDILFADTSILGKILLKVNKRIKKIVFCHNVEKEYAKHRVMNEGWRYIPVFFATKYNEWLSVKEANKLICLNVRDSKLIEKNYDRKPDFLLPISFMDSFDSSKVYREKSDKVLLFIGSNFGPNYDGIKWFINNVMQELKEYNLIIVGKDFENVKEKLERENVTVIGTVQKLDEYYYRYFNIVLPIKYGDGMKVKTAEAMMYGMNIFATNEALEGYETDGVCGIYRCNSSNEFIKNIRQHASGDSINKEVRNIYLKNNCFDNQINIMREILLDW